MRHCEIGKNSVDCSTVTVDLHSFGKTYASLPVKPYRLTLDFADAIECFSSFYQSFTEREAEDEGFDEVLDGDYLRLKETGYLPFEKMLADEPELLARVLLKLLPTEFMGYLFRQRLSAGRASFVLQTLTKVSIDKEKIICEGDSF